MTPERALFQKELRVWSLRTAACAAPSLAFVAVRGSNQVTAWLGMLSGCAAVAGLFTWVSLRTVAEYRSALPHFVRALWLKAISGAIGAVIYLGDFRFLSVWIRVLGSSFGLDVFSGGLIGFFVSSMFPDAVTRGDSFLGAYLVTLLVTLLQGLAIALECAALAAVQLLVLSFFKDDPFRSRP